MADTSFEFDEIGSWSVLKLEILEKYGAAYTRAFNNSPFIKKYYIDGFSGAGLHRTKGTGLAVDGSPSIALKINPPFNRYYFIDLDSGKTDHLRSISKNNPNVVIRTGDANQHLRQLLPNIRHDRYERALCVLDPYGLHLDWDVIELAGRSKVMDMFLNFPVMDMNRNAIWRNPERAPLAGIDRLSKFWGDTSWREAAYVNSAPDLFGYTEAIKQPNAAIVAAFRERLKKAAGFQYVPEPLAMKNSNNADVYYLFFAAAKEVANKIVTDIFARHRR